MAVWYIGSIFLTLEAAALLIQAVEIATNSSTFLWAILGGITMGILMARYLFIPACRQNLLHIKTLEDPRLWQFFQPQIFLFLVLILSANTLLSHWAAGNFNALILAAAVDISIATALLGSSGPFWQQKAEI